MDAFDPDAGQAALLLDVIGNIVVSTTALPSTGGNLVYKTAITQPSLGKTIDIKGTWLVACNPAVLSLSDIAVCMVAMHEGAVAEVKASLHRKSKPLP